MIVQINNKTTITNCKLGTIAEIRRRLTFDNPAFFENEKRGFSNYQADRLIEFFNSFPGGLSFLRGFSGSACRIAKRCKVKRQESI